MTRAEQEIYERLCKADGWLRVAKNAQGRFDYAVALQKIAGHVNDIPVWCKIAEESGGEQCPGADADNIIRK